MCCPGRSRPLLLGPNTHAPLTLADIESNSLGPAAQDARSTKLPMSPRPLCSPYLKSRPRRSRSGDQTGHLAPGILPPFTMLDSNFPAMGGASLEPRNSGPPQVRTKTRAQHAAAAPSGSRSSSSLKCVVDSTLQYTTPNIPSQVQDTPPFSSLSQPLDPQESITPSLLNPAVNSMIDNQSPVLPVEGLKSHSPINNPYVYPPVRQPMVVSKVENTIHSPEDGPTKDCYGWDPMLDGDSDDTNSDQDLDMPDIPHGKISGNTRRMMDQQFAHPTHVSVGKDFMGLEDTLNKILQQLGETVVSDPAKEVQALQAHEDVVQHDPILQAQMTEAQRKACVAMELLHQPTPSQTLVDHCLEGAQGGTKCMSTMEVNGTNYRRPDALISDHPAVTVFLKAKEGQ
jgi:hypothetical protein